LGEGNPVDVRKCPRESASIPGIQFTQIALMGFSDWFRRRRTSSRREDLLAALIDGFECEDYDGLMRLINQNSAAIREQFPSLKKIPEGIRNDPAALDRSTTARSRTSSNKISRRHSRITERRSNYHRGGSIQRHARWTC
jgi:hypothetical protein